MSKIKMLRDGEKIEILEQKVERLEDKLIALETKLYAHGIR